MLVFYLIANIAALRLPREHPQYPTWVTVMGALSCIGLIAFLSPDSWVIGCIGLLIGGTWFFFRTKAAL
jgi:APA family basic amino acid/polyamine antiporter